MNFGLLIETIIKFLKPNMKENLFSKSEFVELLNGLQYFTSILEWIHKRLNTKIVGGTNPKKLFFHFAIYPKM